MTAPNSPPPIDPRSAVSRAAEIVAKEDAETRAAVATQPKRSRMPAVVGLVVLAVLNVAVWIVMPAMSEPPEERSPAAVESDLRLVLAGLGDDIGTWRDEHGGQLPESIVSAGLDGDGVEYLPLGGGAFQLRATSGDVTVSYDSRTAPTAVPTSPSGARP